MPADFELVPEDIKPHELRDELNYRSHKAGYTSREGGPIPRKIQGIVTWGQRRLNVWARDAAGRLIGD